MWGLIDIIYEKKSYISIYRYSKKKDQVPYYGGRGRGRKLVVEEEGLKYNFKNL